VAVAVSVTVGNCVEVEMATVIVGACVEVLVIVAVDAVPDGARRMAIKPAK
jgi:hypothetical protein